jgi:hypothetical protein
MPIASALSPESRTARSAYPKGEKVIARMAATPLTASASAIQ